MTCCVGNMGSKIKILSLNINGLQDKIKQKRLSALHNAKPELVMLQETHLKENGNMVLRDKAFPYQYHSKGSSKTRGTAILIHRSIHFKELVVKREDRGCFLAVKGLLNGELVTLISLYAPNTAQVPFLEDTFQKILEFGDGTVIAAGDLNYICDMKLDRTYKHGHTSILKENTSTKLQELLDLYDLTDTWRFLNPDAFYSLQHKTHTRIDFILTSKGSEENWRLRT